MTTAADLTVVIPTIGKTDLTALLTAIAAGPVQPAGLLVVDDRPDPPGDLSPLRLPAGVGAKVLRSGGRGPAAARNVGWIASDTAWVAFLDDDVRVGPEWFGSLLNDLTGLSPTDGASCARIEVPAPVGRRPTDEERRTLTLTDAQWITADMAYRREALLATGGFDERFPRAFREDSDLALRTIEAGFRIVQGRRITVHPLRSRGGWRSSILAQAGNADNALLRAKFGRGWRRRIGEGPGRTAHHLITVASAATAVTGLVLRRPGVAGLGALAWVAATAEFAVRRILPGPRTPAEIATMVVTSAAIPPVALFWRVRGELGVRRGNRLRPARAVLFDRDGTLMHDVPYLADPDLVQPVDGAVAAVGQLRTQGVPIGVVSNQSGIARGLIDSDQLRAVNRRLEALLGPFDTWQLCQHGPDDGCQCRKPSPVMIRRAARDLGVDPADCVYIGDIGADVQAALQAGARGVLVPTAATRQAEVAHARHCAVVCADLPAAVAYAMGGRL